MEKEESSDCTHSEPEDVEEVESEEEKSVKLEKSEKESESVIGIGGLFDEDYVSVPKKKTDDDDKSTKSVIDIKLSKDSFIALSKLLKNEFLFKIDSPSDILKVQTVTNEDEPDKLKVKAKSDKGDTFTIDIKNFHEFSVHKMIKVVLTNYLNKVFEIYFPINLNENFQKFRENFLDQYDLEDENVALIFKDKRVSTKELEKFKFSKDFNFEKDYILLVQSKRKNDIVKFESEYATVNLKNAVQVRKSVIITDSIVGLTDLFFMKGTYEGSTAKMNKLEIYEVDENPAKYEKKLKKKATDECDKYNFDALLTKKFKPECEEENYDLIYSVDNVNCPYQNNEDKKYDDFYCNLRNYYFQYAVNSNITFFPDKIYVLVMEVTSSSNIRISKFPKKRKTYLSDMGNSFSIFIEKKYKESVINAIEFKPLTLFEV